jgi:SAM-dependent methyltransferase
MNLRQQHWEGVYATKSTTEVSWFRPHLDLSLELIERFSPGPSAAIIDIGAGACTLVDDLMERGYSDISVLDISAAATGTAKDRLGPAAARVQWLVGDICEIPLPPSRYDLWHDRAVFHFLTSPDQRAAYAAQAAASLKPGSHIILATFGPEGPLRCSGLDTVRYSASALAAEFASAFRPLENHIDWHTTPSGGRQQFLYCVLQKA